MSERRNDSTHFPALNGGGHRRRKVINLPTETRYVLDRYEARALDLIGEMDRWLADLARGVERRGDPGE
jgi:hypothetical protein